ncbi:MAG TPA: two-component system response regulator [Marinilabiliales bacterium]|nr:two-component system response regulator [Marinilabiliales bacterium]
MYKLRTILLAEDNSKDVELTIEAMAENNLGNQVVIVKDGIEAMEYLRREGKYKLRNAGNPCVILLDIKMPRMDGIEVLRSIRSDDKLKKVPVVMITSSREERDLIKTYELGVNAFVVKPVSFQQFIEAIKQIGSFWAVLNELPLEEEQ